jgi:prophage tail gpP-like protein
VRRARLGHRARPAVRRRPARAAAYNTTDKAATITAKVAAHQGAQSGTLWLTLIVPLSAAWSGARAARLVAARHNWSLDAKIAQIRLNMAAS